MKAALRIIRQDFDRAGAQAAEALSLGQQLEDPRAVAWSLDVFAALLAAQGHADGAGRLWGASDGLLESVGGSLVPTIGWIAYLRMSAVRPHRDLWLRPLVVVAPCVLIARKVTL